jgi:predicted DCC family thiol-disulfide oxidoreductase YuxK
VRAGIGKSVSDGENGGRLLVIFDGHCGLCNGTVRWLLRHDGRDRLRFAAFDSPRVGELLRVAGMNEAARGDGPGTILVVRNLDSTERQLVTRSDAIVALLGELPQPWTAVGGALGLIPRPIRDLGYRLVARWRYRIWGRVDICPLPMAADQAKFL